MKRTLHTVGNRTHVPTCHSLQVVGIHMQPDACPLKTLPLPFSPTLEQCPKPPPPHPQHKPPHIECHRLPLLSPKRTPLPRINHKNATDLVRHRL
eukprot:364328-Chlamydomonas_euryale.AAC.12